MAKFNKPNGNKKSIGVIIVTIVFAIIGIICIVIGYKNEILAWIRTFGIVALVLVSPILIFVIYNVIIKKIKEM